VDASLATIVAGVVAAVIGALVTYYLGGLREKQRQERERALVQVMQERERERAQDIALQAYYEQIGQLLTEHDLRNTQRIELRELARSHTLTALRGLDGNGKGSLLTFLHSAGLIIGAEPSVALIGADFQGVDLEDAFLQGASLQGAILNGANLQEADLLTADLQGADLQGANLQGTRLQDVFLQGTRLREADLQGADLRATYGLTQEQLEHAYRDQHTLYPDNLKPPAHWSGRTDEQIEGD
jgi:Pentapeptide repeats (8 copies)